jgi:hypothetical protein
MSKHKVKRYDGEDGSEVEVGGANPAPETAMTELPPMPEAPEAQATAKPASFKEAFAAARKGGGKTFEYNGKKYTTDMASAPAKKAPMAAGPGRAPAPPARKLVQETVADRAESYGNKRAAARAADTAAAAAKASTAAETARLRQRNMPSSKFDASKVDPNTLLPKRMASGGSVSSRADGIAQRGKTRGKMC